MKAAQHFGTHRFPIVPHVLAVVCAIAATLGTARGQTEQVLYSFVPRTGMAPTASLILDAEGNLYGTASAGNQNSPNGSVFELSPSVGGGWTETEILTFKHIQDGWNPSTPLVADAAGNFYTTTLQGGTSNTNCINGCGVVFELPRTSGGGWAETVLYSFQDTTDGSQPHGGLVLDANGDIYGTTYWGGNLSDCGGYGCGVVFKLSRSAGGWKETVLHTFTGGVDGAHPSASLIFDASGNLYGTTYAGGNVTDCPSTVGCGVAFELSVSGISWKENVLHTFSGQDGANPLAGLIFDTDGNLFGTTYSGGDLKACSSQGCGAVFELSRGNKAWKENLLYSFGGGQHGGNPAANLIFDPSGNLYGTTLLGGNSKECENGCGTVFELSPAGSVWNEAVLHAFTAHGDGSLPSAGLILDHEGNLYGTTDQGGTAADGAVFEVTR